jgi:hypothetical protein
MTGDCRVKSPLVCLLLNSADDDEDMDMVSSADDGHDIDDDNDLAHNWLPPELALSFIKF